MAKRSRTSHRNLTFLYTTSKQSCLRLWLALDDVMLIDNGCLWTKSASFILWDTFRMYETIECKAGDFG